MNGRMDDYWSNEIKSYATQRDNGPDDNHELLKWREFLKIGRIMNAEIKCKEIDQTKNSVNEPKRR